MIMIIMIIDKNCNFLSQITKIVRNQQCTIKSVILQLRS